MGFVDLVNSLYLRRLRRQVASGPIPRHVALIIDGNRRWARQMGLAHVSLGHQAGAEHIDTVLGWCADAGIRHVTVFVASADNIRKRSPDEITFLMHLTERVIAERLAQPSSRWRIHLAGHLDLLPDSTAHALKLARETTAGQETDSHVTLAIGYSGRAELVDALRSLFEHEGRAGTSVRALADRLSTADIASHLDTSGQPAPDLVIRTSGEQRLSDFLIWQTAYSELHFCDVYWPGFRQRDFLRALRAYATRLER
ncbi:polyprenyl diphosphate synthase [Actinopolymorpha sp. B11F2]|uniref:polyprenyl diphosphate synthase n=1 Tax=Actinopolymorpha sp. B11F2 TaxID=3160862 RepID=UPI0032E4018A